MASQKALKWRRKNCSFLYTWCGLKWRRKKPSNGVAKTARFSTTNTNSHNLLSLILHSEMLFSSASVTIIALFLSLVNAHASLNPPVSRASYSQSNLRVPHGCNGSDTVSVEVSIPVGLSSVKPQKVAGFVMTISKRPLAVPSKSF
jgi:hypothetical protein